MHVGSGELIEDGDLRSKIILISIPPCINANGDVANLVDYVLTRIETGLELSRGRVVEVQIQSTDAMLEKVRC